MTPHDGFSHARPRARAGITAMESLLSIAIVSIAGAALMSALTAAVHSSREIALTLVADGLANQLMAEVAASPVPQGSAPSRPTGPRLNFRYIDHCDGWSESPPRDRTDRILGTEGALGSTAGSPRPVELQADIALLSRFTRTIRVEKVIPSSGTWIQTTADSPFRRVTVEVSFSDERGNRPMSRVSRIVSHVSPSL